MALLSSISSADVLEEEKHSHTVSLFLVQKKEEAMERLSIIGHSNDGFEIANEDLKLSGPGRVFWCKTKWNDEFCTWRYLLECRYFKNGF